MWPLIAKPILGDITVSVGAFLALVIIVVNWYGTRRSKKGGFQTIKVRPEVKPNILKGPKLSLVSSTFSRTFNN